MGIRTAQCLYVLTEDNPPVSDEIRANFSYVSCLLEIAKARASVQDVKGKNDAAEERAVALGILACGAFVFRESVETILGVLIVKMRRYSAKPGTVPATVVYCVGRPR